MDRTTRTYFTLNVGDMARAVAFYRAVVGAPVVRYESDQISELKLGPATVALHAGGNPRESGLVVEVPDLDAAISAVPRMGGMVISGPYASADGSRAADVNDSEGNGLTLAGAA
ncbi:MAG: VOC family protein [Actinobacteria bacterium]|nr:VOC family protein [Actinomycetota bacterium]